MGRWKPGTSGMDKRWSVVGPAKCAVLVVGAVALQACHASRVELVGDAVEDDTSDVSAPDSWPEADADAEEPDVGPDASLDGVSEEDAAEGWDGLVHDVAELADDVEDPADDGWGWDVPLVCEPPLGPTGWLTYVEGPDPAPLERRGQVRVAAHRGPIGAREYQVDLEWAGGGRGRLTYRTPEGAEERLPVEPGSTWEGWLRTDGSILVLQSLTRLLAFHEADADLADPADLQGWSLFSVPLPCDFVPAPCGEWRGLALGVVSPDGEERDPVYPRDSLWFRTRDGDVWLVFGSGFERGGTSCPGEPLMWIEYLLRVERSG